MNKYVVDTMALILRIEKRVLPAQIKKIFTEAEKNNTVLYIPSMVFAEIGYLSERKRIDITLKDVEKYLQMNTSIKQHNVSLYTTQKAFEIKDIPELHDRIIAGVAFELDIPVISNDPKMLNSKFINAIW
jgi:predicted nucleic acid-binding protein